MCKDFGPLNCAKGVIDFLIEKSSVKIHCQSDISKTFFSEQIESLVIKEDSIDFEKFDVIIIFQSSVASNLEKGR